MFNNRVIPKTWLIYNPKAGGKRQLLPTEKATTSKDIRHWLEQYRIPVKIVATRGPGDATRLAKDAVRKKADLVIAAGGDGTVSEVAAGLVGTRVKMGIIPTGTFMNLAKMLAIPMDLEKAVQVLKINRARKIDVGILTKINGEKLPKPSYFLEVVGVGLVATAHWHLREWEQGNWLALGRLAADFLAYSFHRVQIEIDDKQMLKTRAPMLAISNGSQTGANLKLSPLTKLNDHRLTVSVFIMTKLELLRYFLGLVGWGKVYSPKIHRFRGQKIKVFSPSNITVHADAQKFGTTPIEVRVWPSALTVVTGFSSPQESALKEKRPI